MKYFCFRFDVDTHVCIREGMPNLLRLADELNVRFTFFVNMGKGISRIDYLRNKLSYKHRRNGTTPKLSNLKKLGLSGFLSAAIANPRVGGAHPEVLRSAHAAGHEIGLHGGSNHAVWINHAARWPREKLHREVELALGELVQAGVPLPDGFASPGWQGSDALNAALEALGFQYVADIHDADTEDVVSAGTGLNLRTIPTNICSEPDGVGYIEHLRARRLNDSEIIADFARRLERRNNLAVVYDHPYYAGIAELDIVRQLVQVAEAQGFKVGRLCDVMQTAEVPA